MKPCRHEFGLMLIMVLAGLLICALLPAQSPEKMSYQAVVRDAGGVLLSNQSVGIRIQILQTSEFGAAVFVETHTRTTNSNGLVTLEIGGGSVVMGSFSGINWNNGPYFLKTEIDPGGGTSYSIIGTTQLMSVPYALYSKQAGNVFSGDYNDLTNKPVLFDGTWNSLTGKPILSIVATSGITGSNMITITNDNNISISNVGAVSGEVLKYNGSTWSAEPDWDTNTTYSAGSGLSLSGTIFSLAPGTSTGQMKYWNGTAWVNVPPGKNGQTLVFLNGAPTWWPQGLGTTDVYNPSTGKIWMDRNLGATQVATSSTDANSYGHLYQWGRGTDGHQLRTSTLSSSDTPGHANFILAPSSPYDWRSPQNTNLWQGVSGVNNPCPAGYRLPTESEWDLERLTWSSNNAAGAFASPLKLPVAGDRHGSDGSLYSTGSSGLYWSSTVITLGSRSLNFASTTAAMANFFRVMGLSVRCIKN
jgi:uncharacterized protein (TIGR02145 family)